MHVVQNRTKREDKTFDTCSLHTIHEATSDLVSKR